MVCKGAHEPMATSFATVPITMVELVCGEFCRAPSYATAACLIRYDNTARHGNACGQTPEHVGLRSVGLAR